MHSCHILQQSLPLFHMFSWTWIDLSNSSMQRSPRVENSSAHSESGGLFLSLWWLCLLWLCAFTIQNRDPICFWLFLTGAERVFAIFIWTPEGPQAQWGDSKHPSGNIQLRACSLGPLPSHAQGDWGDFSHFDWTDSKDLWSCWTPRWGKVANKTKRICFWDYFNLYKVMRPCVCFFLSNQTALPWSHGVVGVGGTLKIILFVLPPFGN